MKKGKNALGDEDKVNEKNYRVYYSSRRENNAKNLISYAKTRIVRDKKKVGWKDFLSPQGTIHGLLESTTYYITVVAVNIRSLRESEPTPIKAVTTTKTLFGDAPIIKSIVPDGDSLRVTFTPPTNLKTKEDGDAILLKKLFYLMYISDIPPNNDPHSLVNNVRTNYATFQDFYSRNVKNVVYYIPTFSDETEIPVIIRNLEDNTTFYLTIKAIIWDKEESIYKQSSLSAVKSGTTSTAHYKLYNSVNLLSAVESGTTSTAK